MTVTEQTRVCYLRVFKLQHNTVHWPTTSYERI